MSVTAELADTPTRGLPTHRLDNSRTGQLAVSHMRQKNENLSSPRVDQSASWRIRELSSNLNVSGSVLNDSVEIWLYVFHESVIFRIV